MALSIATESRDPRERVNHPNCVGGRLLVEQAKRVKRYLIRKSGIVLSHGLDLGSALKPSTWCGDLIPLRMVRRCGKRLVELSFVVGPLGLLKACQRVSFSGRPHRGGEYGVMNF